MSSQKDNFPNTKIKLPRGPHVVDLSQPGLAILRDKKTKKELMVISRANYDSIVKGR